MPSPSQASQRPPLTLKLKAPRPVTACARFGNAGEQVANGREQAGIGGRIAARCAPNRALVDVDHLVEKFHAMYRVKRRGRGAGAVQGLCGDFVQRVVNQGGLARAGDAGDAGKQTDWNFQRVALQVVAAGTF